MKNKVKIIIIILVLAAGISYACFSNNTKKSIEIAPSVQTSQPSNDTQKSSDPQSGSVRAGLEKQLEKQIKNAATPEEKQGYIDTLNQLKKDDATEAATKPKEKEDLMHAQEKSIDNLIKQHKENPPKFEKMHSASISD